jgi:DNA-binding ferritin-like protein (Dps family)
MAARFLGDEDVFGDDVQGFVSKLLRKDLVCVAT